MSQTKRRYWLAVFFITLYNLLAGANEVYVANLVQRMDPFLLVFLCFFITALFFNILQVKDFKGYLTKIREKSRDVILVNISTMASWLGFFFALKYVEPAIVATINGGIGPVFMLVLGRYLRPNSRVLSMEVFAAFGIFFSLIILVWVSLTGRSALGEHLSEGSLIGMLTALMCGTAIVANSLFSKRLNDSGWNAASVMSVRFFLLVLCAFGVLIFRNQLDSLSLGDFVPILLIVFGGTIIPLYSLQVGIELSEPISLSLLLSLGPFFTLLLQAFDIRLVGSIYTAIGIFATVFFVTLGILARHRSFK